MRVLGFTYTRERRLLLVGWNRLCIKRIGAIGLIEMFGLRLAWVGKLRALTLGKRGLLSWAAA